MLNNIFLTAVSIFALSGCGDLFDSSSGPDDTTLQGQSVNDSSNSNSNINIGSSNAEGWDELEIQVVALINDIRSEGYDCASRGYFPPAPPLDYNDILRESGMAHAIDMANRGYFDHMSPDGVSPTTRMVEAGYDPYALVLENIAGGQSTPASAVRAWLDSDGHCANIMHPDAEDIGLAYYFDEDSIYKHYWVHNGGRIMR